jgi:uncharacterized cupin superfamily protein
VLEGEVTLVTDDGEQLLTPGTYCGFPAGTQLGHQLINKSDRPARYLEVSNRHPEDSATYTDPAVDMAYKKVDGKNVFTHRDGRPY